MAFIVTIANPILHGTKGAQAHRSTSDHCGLNGRRRPWSGACCVFPFGGVAAGPFFIDSLPGLWDDLSSKLSVQSPAPFPAGTGVVTITAFASFFSAINLTTKATFDNDYQLDVIDGAGSVTPASTFTLFVTADPALNKSVVFLLDRTFTMGNTYAGVTRLQRLQVAITRALVFFQDTDNIGAVSLDHVFPPTNPQGASSLRNAAGGNHRNGLVRTACSGLCIDQNPPNKVYQGALDFTRAQRATATVLLVTDGVAGPRITLPTTTQVTPTSALFIEAVCQTAPSARQAPARS